MLIIFGGLPGVGKSTLARALSARIAAVYLRIDSIEDAVRTSHLAPPDVMDAGYVAAQAVATDNLRLGRTVMGDSVNPIPATRAAWRAAAERAGAGFVEVEAVCSDRAAHRSRVTARAAAQGADPASAWARVERRDYRPWPEAAIRLDTAARDAAAALDDLIRALEDWEETA